jgi:hopanoid biosynthesis associated protein HpnK
VKQLIVSADDFGTSFEVNDAIERAHREGILRATSLMVTGAAAADAVERAQRLPQLAVGLHIVTVFGRPALPPRRVPELVDARGELPTNLAGAGVRYSFNAKARRQLRDEIAAQFEAFVRTGLRLDHVDAQCHMHVHPVIFATLLDVGKSFGLRAVRVPREPLGPAYGARRDRLAARLLNAAITEPWLALMRRRAKAAGLVLNDYAFGVNDAGAMTETRVLGLIQRLPDGLSEMFFHPATGPYAGADRGTEGYAWAGELAALTSSRVRDALERAGIRMTTYGELAAA